MAYGWHVYQTTAHESFIPRLFNAGMFFSEYVMGGLLKLLFTSQWWKVLLAILGADACHVCSDDYAEGILYAFFLSMIFNALRYDAGILEFVDDCCRLIAMIIPIG